MYVILTISLVSPFTAFCVVQFKLLSLNVCIDSRFLIINLFYFISMTSFWTTQTSKDHNTTVTCSCRVFRCFASFAFWRPQSPVGPSSTSCWFPEHWHGRQLTHRGRDLQRQSCEVGIFWVGAVRLSSAINVFLCESKVMSILPCIFKPLGLSLRLKGSMQMGWCTSASWRGTVWSTQRM